MVYHYILYIHIIPLAALSLVSSRQQRIQFMSNIVSDPYCPSSSRPSEQPRQSTERQPFHGTNIAAASCWISDWISIVAFCVKCYGGQNYTNLVRIHAVDWHSAVDGRSWEDMVATGDISNAPQHFGRRTPYSIWLRFLTYCLVTCLPCISGPFTVQGEG
jgi:hypothetical protein